MTRALKWSLRLALAIPAAAIALVLNDNITRNQPAWLLSEAHAVTGRPLTPLSYAGVARRTTRPAVTVYAPSVYAPGCYQVADVYGRLYWNCPQATQPTSGLPPIGVPHPLGPIGLPSQR
jgi:hypothetical protein